MLPLPPPEASQRPSRCVAVAEAMQGAAAAANRNGRVQWLVHREEAAGAGAWTPHRLAMPGAVCDGRCAGLLTPHATAYGIDVVQPAHLQERRHGSRSARPLVPARWLPAAAPSCTAWRHHPPSCSCVWAPEHKALCRQWYTTPFCAKLPDQDIDDSVATFRNGVVASFVAMPQRSSAEAFTQMPCSRMKS